MTKKGTKAKGRGPKAVPVLPLEGSGPEPGARKWARKEGGGLALALPELPRELGLGKNKAAAGFVASLWHCADQKAYVEFRGADKSMRRLASEEVRQELKVLGVQSRPQPHEAGSQLDRIQTWIRRERGIHRMLPMAAGWPPGVYGFDHGFGQGRTAVLAGFEKVVEPEPGNFPNVAAFLDQFAGVGNDEHGDTQRLILDLLAARWWRHCVAGERLDLPALVIAGPPGAGKTFFVSEFVVHLLGGEPAADTSAFLFDQTPFNGDQLSATVLTVDDKLRSPSYKERRAAGDNLKAFVGSRVKSIHPKHGQRMALPLHQAVLILLNDSPENMRAMLPVEEEDIKDKVIGLKAFPVAIPPAGPGRERWVQMLHAELGAYLAHVLNLETPPILREAGNERFGIAGGALFGDPRAAFKHPSLVEALRESEPESHLLDLIDRQLFGGTMLPGTVPEPWEGSASELRQRIMDGAANHVIREAEEIAKTADSVGRYLNRLQGRYPERFVWLGHVKRGGRTKRVWKIFPPTDEEGGDGDGLPG